MVSAGRSRRAPFRQRREGITLLESALIKCRPGVISELLKFGANPSEPGLGRATALHNAKLSDPMGFQGRSENRNPQRCAKAFRRSWSGSVKVVMA